MTPDVWLDSVGTLFDSISTAPRGVRFGNDMENSDAQSHFDLGQAFKEMGLFDEAINEFRQAVQEPSRRVECLIMQCACLRERGEVDKAISMLQALLKQGLTEDECCSVKYELATGYQMSGRRDDATVLLNEIKTANPDFRDINTRLNAANMSESLDFSDDDLLNF
jgi:lipopolysaccharide biosynthesis regulator YciM